MCDQQLITQCETTEVRDQAMDAPLFGCSELWGQHLPAAAKGTRFVGALDRYGSSVWTVWRKRGNADACATTSIADLAGTRGIPAICTQYDAIVRPTPDHARRSSSSR
jgi:hypothetical protein